MSVFDPLQPPALSDPLGNAYKEWYHANFFDHENRRIGLINTSLHGQWGGENSQAVATGLVFDPENGWLGNVHENRFSDIALDQYGIMLPQTAIGIAHSQEVLSASVDMPVDELTVRLEAKPLSSPFRMQTPMPFGSGWIAWSAVPVLKAKGRLRRFRQDSSLDSTTVYHDHNWGRWFWGDDCGWEWGVFTAGDSGPTVVFSVVTNSDHSIFGLPHLYVIAGGRARQFVGDHITVEREREVARLDRRIPGVMASLHKDRSSPLLHRRVSIEVKSGFDWFRLEFSMESAIQLILAEPMRQGYGFIHELCGEFTLRGKLEQVELDHHGLGVFEYVE